MWPESVSASLAVATGSLYIVDDAGGRIWKVSYSD